MEKKARVFVEIWPHTHRPHDNRLIVSDLMMRYLLKLMHRRCQISFACSFSQQQSRDIASSYGARWIHTLFRRKTERVSQVLQWMKTNMCCFFPDFRFDV